MIRYDLIQKELSHPDVPFHKLKLSNRIIDKMYNKYNADEITIHFYDSEPEIPRDLFEKHYRLTCCDNADGLTDLEACELDVEMKKYDKAYAEKRITHNNWIEVFGPGIWDFSQKETNNQFKYMLKSIRRGNYCKKDRFYISDAVNGFTYIYCYMRDVEECDYWFVLKEKR